MSLRHTKQPLDRRRPGRLLRKQQELHQPLRRTTPTRLHHNLTRSGELQLAGHSLFI